jgi:hypothetical protein
LTNIILEINYIHIYISQYLSEIKNKDEIISDAHSGILGGHYSVEKTLQKIRQKYNWSNIIIDVKEFINKCETCQFNKPGTQKPYIYSLDIPQAPSEKISIDIMHGSIRNNKQRKSVHPCYPRLPDMIHPSGTPNK